MDYRMNYVNFKNYVNNKLNALKEDLVRDVTIPSNTISYNGAMGSFIINPFGANTYSYDITFNSKDKLDAFIKEIAKSDLYSEIEDDANISDDGIHNHFVISGFINEALLEIFQVELKRILNGLGK